MKLTILLAIASSMLVPNFVSGQDSPTRGAAPWKANAETVESLTKRRAEFNYVEANVPTFTLPDPLVDLSDKQIATAAAWPGRRAELLQLFRENVYGHRPTTEAKITFEVLEQRDALAGMAVGRTVKVMTRIQERSYDFLVTVFIPKQAAAPVPAFVHINNRYFLTLEEAEKNDPFWPVKDIVARGYATASFHTSDVDPDRKDAYADGIRAFFADGAPPKDNAWRSLSAWGWAASRVLDYLETCEQVDATRASVSGHSRGGKTALWAAAEDTRFAIGYSNNSGCGGAALSRRQFGETVERITTSFPYWFTPNFAKFSGKENTLPVDQHELVSLIAPRATYVTSSDEDLWADPKGEYASVVAAAPVYKLLGKQSISHPAMPALNAPRHVGATGYHIRDGGHGLGQTDWNWFMDFADARLK